jgi:cell division GTPase FtsZ
MLEISSAAEIIKDKINPDATFIFGASIDPSYEDKFEVTVLATGFDMDYTTGEFMSMSRPGDSSSNSDRASSFVKKPEVATRPNMMGNLQRQAPVADTEDDLESLPSFLRRRKDYGNE